MDKIEFWGDSHVDHGRAGRVRVVTWTRVDSSHLFSWLELGRSETLIRLSDSSQTESLVSKLFIISCNQAIFYEILLYLIHSFLSWTHKIGKFFRGFVNPYLLICPMMRTLEYNWVHGFFFPCCVYARDSQMQKRRNKLFSTNKIMQNRAKSHEITRNHSKAIPLITQKPTNSEGSLWFQMISNNLWWLLSHTNAKLH